MELKAGYDGGRKEKEFSIFEPLLHAETVWWQFYVGLKRTE